MAKGKGSDSAIGGGIIFIIVLIAMIPKEVWIALGIGIGISILLWLIYKAQIAHEERQAEAAKQARIREAAEAKRARQLFIESLGQKNAGLVDAARAAVKQVAASEAARAGWLGDIDFTTDIAAITDKFQKAHALRQVAKDLSALDKPSADDRTILAEANTTIATLESAAIERVELIQRCAFEARSIDESLRSRTRRRQDRRAACATACQVERHALRDRGHPGLRAGRFRGGRGDGAGAGVSGDQAGDHAGAGRGVKADNSVVVPAGIEPATFRV